MWKYGIPFPEFLVGPPNRLFAKIFMSVIVQEEITGSLLPSSPHVQTKMQAMEGWARGLGGSLMPRPHPCGEEKHLVTIPHPT